MADGRKVRDSYGSFPIRTSTPLDSIVNNTDPYITEHNDWSEDYYYSGRLYRIATPEGFIRFVNRVGYSIFYSMKDHVGSFRGYWEPGYTNGPITFSYPSYHPSGIIYRKPYTGVPFALGGKEFMGTNNLDEYFFGARTMYAIMNRFNQMDPLCEKYYSVSPYAYCGNNPVNRIDSNGKDWIVANGSCYYIWRNDITSKSEIPDGFRYVGANDADILMDLGLDYSLSERSTNKIGLIASDVESGRYVISHMANVKERSNALIDVDVSYNNDGRIFNGIDIKTTTVSSNSNVDGNLISAASVDVQYGDKTYSSTLMTPNGPQLLEQGSTIKTATICIPKIHLSPTSTLSQIRIKGNWWVSTLGGMTPVTPFPGGNMVPIPIGFKHVWSLKK